MPAVLLLACLCSSAAATVVAQGRTGAVPRARAVELFTANCQLCHGAEGKGSPLMQGSAFVGRKWKHGSTIPAITKTITNGVPGTPMLPFKGKFTPAEISALASLVRSFDKKPRG